jgi:uncharacterized protein YyaL (SSP411 family)
MQVKPKPASVVFAEAVKTAKKQNKSIFLHFTASWCGWCHKLEAALSDPTIAKLMGDNYVLVSLDVMEQGPKKANENPGGNELMKELGGAKSGLPFLVFFDKTGKKLADSNVMPKDQNIGYPGAPEEIVAFGELLKKTAPRLTDIQRTQITDWLTKNAPK